MEQGGQAVADLPFQIGDAGHDGFDGFRGLVFIEVPGHGDFIADLSFRFVDPGVRGVGQHLPGEVGVHVLLQRHVLRVPQVGIGHGLTLL